MTDTDQTRRPVDLSDLYAALDSAATVMAMSSRDWSRTDFDTWLYGIFVGWDNDPTGGDVDQHGSVLDELAARYGWDDDKVYRLRMLRLAVVRFDLNAVADLADADDLRRRLKHAEYMERMASRHAMQKDAEIAEADARVAGRVADVARLEADTTRLRLELHDARAQIERLQALVDGDNKPGPAQVAETLRSAASGRRETAAALRGDQKFAEQVDALDLQAHTLDAAACVAEGDLSPLYDWLPSHRWSREMLAALYDKPADDNKEQR